MQLNDRRRKSDNFSRAASLVSVILVMLPLVTFLHGSTPVSTYGTYFGSGGENGIAVATDAQGDVIIVGSTTSQSLPGTTNAYQPTKANGFPDNRDVFVAKFDPTGRKLLWTTFLGGDGDDAPVGVAVDPAGNIYVAGTTQSLTFPITKGAYQAASPGDSFVSKLSADGSALIYSTGLPQAQATALAVSNVGEAYVVGSFSPFPSSKGNKLVTPGALNRGVGLSVYSCIFVVRLNVTGTDLVFGANLGGGDGLNGSRPSSVAIDADGGIYLAGGSAVDSVPTTPDALQTTFSNEGLSPSSPNSINNGFIVKTNSMGSQVLYGTYFGPRYAATTIIAIAVAPDGSLYFLGTTNATTFQATPGAYLSTAGTGYVARLRRGATLLDAFSYLPSTPLSLTLGSDQTLRSIYPVPYKYGLEEAEEYVVLAIPTLALVGVAPTFNAVASAQGVPPKTGWLVGLSPASSNYGGYFVTPDAFQAVLKGPSDAFLQQITLVNPVVSSVGNAASLAATNVAPGELVSIFGSELGPPAGAGAALDANNVAVSSVGGVQALFDGVPAPLLFVRADQVNTIVPFGVVGHVATQLVIQYQGAQSSPVILGVQASLPGIFTADGSGKGQAAALNQDFSANSSTNAAPRGSVISFYVTGGGQMSPAAKDGQVIGATLPEPVLPVIVGIANAGVNVLYKGAAPGIVAGVLQMNVQIPADAPTGPSIPIVVRVGDTFSQPGATIAIK